MLSIIGSGTYGKVILVKKKGSKELFAMKVIKKALIIEKEQVRHTMSERKILEKIDHPFIIKLRYAFQSDEKLFFVVDYCPGGDLFFYISNIGRFNELATRFYAASIVLALECLH
jgi:serum/glucocorticoid-regulated kinase 2